MKLFTTDDLARKFVDEVDRIQSSKDSDEMKRALLAGTAGSYAFLFYLAVNGVSVALEDTEKKEVSK
jgi:hypothetical protein